MNERLTKRQARAGDRCADKVEPGLAKRLESYSAVAGAMAAGAMAAGPGAYDADAAIVYSGVQNITITASSSSGIYVDIDGMATGSGSFAGFDLRLFNTYSSTSSTYGLLFSGAGGAGNASAAVTSLGKFVENLSSGDAINNAARVFRAFDGSHTQPLPALATQDSYDARNSGPFSNSIGIMGFRFIIGANTHFGWMSIDVPRGFDQGGAGSDAVIIDWAYEDAPNTPIIAGDTVSALLAGDLNGDGFVGVDDLNIVLINWNLNVTPGDLLSGDPSGEGFVGVDDLNIILVNWNNGTPPPGAADVPEPTSLGLLATGAFGVLATRRRHRAKNNRANG